MNTTASSISASEQRIDRCILEDLFFEQDTEVLATNYKHGVLRSVFVLARTLFFVRGRSGSRT